MELSLKTSTLQELMAKAVKGASNNKLIPLTSLICIKLEKGTLTLITTDATNYLYAKAEKIAGDDFYAVVEIDTLSKLIARLTCEDTKLILKDSSLEIVGNGTYNIEIPVDEEGNAIKYPDPLSSINLKKVKKQEIHLSTINTILDTLKPALATTLETPCYTGYYSGDRVVATDTFKIASMAVQLFEEPVLISPEMMNLLSVMTQENIEVQIKDDVLVFNSKDISIYGNTLEGIDEFQIDAISSVVDSEFNSTCTVDKAVLLQILDRLSLFVGAYDKNAIELVFTKKGLQISSKASTGVEIIKYIDSENFSDFSCDINIVMLTTQIKANADDVITIHYGGDTPALKMTDGNVTHLIAFLESEDTE